MKAGDLDRLITIQSLTVTQNDLNEDIEEWSDYLTNIAAQVKPLTNRELWAASQVNSEITHRFIIRWREGINERMRIVYDGKYWNLSTPLEIGRREGLSIWAWAYPEREA